MLCCLIAINICLMGVMNEKIQYIVFWGNNGATPSTYYLKKDRSAYAKYMAENSIAIMAAPESEKLKYIDFKNVEYVNNLLAAEGGFSRGQRNEALVANREMPIGQHIDVSNINYEVVGYTDPNSSLEWIESIILKGENPLELNEYINIKIINAENIDDDLEIDESLIQEADQNLLLRCTISLVCIIWGIIALIMALSSEKAKGLHVQE